ncbi:hypothetical protein AC578_1483 [Pseudocercospora eumusae]|uniref:Uncharacterized protein n=1 Tax=Pseudocercospora eumusae TaxID=321146 RepID=A0A139H5J0_9PEZI|nr:hypothetical protein AC578_1483 [Pseudocercospora eumusae]
MADVFSRLARLMQVDSKDYTSSSSSSAETWSASAKVGVISAFLREFGISSAWHLGAGEFNALYHRYNCMPNSSSPSKHLVSRREFWNELLQIAPASTSAEHGPIHHLGVQVFLESSLAQDYCVAISRPQGSPVPDATRQRQELCEERLVDLENEHNGGRSEASDTLSDDTSSDDTELEQLRRRERHEAESDLKRRYQGRLVSLWRQEQDVDRRKADLAYREAELRRNQQQCAAQLASLQRQEQDGVRRDADLTRREAELRRHEQDAERRKLDLARREDEVRQDHQRCADQLASARQREKELMEQVKALQNRAPALERREQQLDKHKAELHAQRKALHQQRRELDQVASTAHQQAKTITPPSLRFLLSEDTCRCLDDFSMYVEHLRHTGDREAARAFKACCQESAGSGLDVAACQDFIRSAEAHLKARSVVKALKQLGRAVNVAASALPKFEYAEEE